MLVSSPGPILPNGWGHSIATKHRGGSIRWDGSGAVFWDRSIHDTNHVILWKEVTTSVGEILSYVSALLNDWGVMPFIKTSMLIVTVIGTIVLIRRMAVGS